MNSGHPSDAWNPLPLEIWRLILQFLRAHGQEHAASAIRIHPVLVEQAESVLYREIRIATFAQAADLKSALSSSALRPKTVRKLHLLMPSKNQLHCFDFLSFVGEILEQLPGLVTLEAEGIDPRHHRRSIPVLPMLVMGTSLPVKRLRGDRVHLNPNFAEFLRKHPQLEEVRLEARRPLLHGPGPALIGEPRDVRLESLNLLKLHTLGCNHRLIAPVNNPRNITRLYVTEDSADSDMIHDIVRIFGAQLVSLRVDLYHSLHVGSSDWKYPTLRDYPWEKCPRLKFLHIDDGSLRSDRPSVDLSDDYQYGVEERKKGKLPPALETLVWAPPWTRYDGWSRRGLQDGHRRAIRRFSEAVLKDFTSMREVIYLWSEKGYFHCSLSTAGEWRERQADPREADRDTWAEVS
ncbi:hypothetical protein V8D89_004045 [Ganoderma adspersum]